MHNILVIRGGALGDFLVTLPAFKLLRDQWPDARIEFLGNPRFGELGLNRYYFDGVRSLERGSLARFFVPGAELDPDWADYFSEFDLLISYLYDPDDFFHANLARCATGQIIRGTPEVRVSPASRHFAQPLKELGLTLDDPGSELFLTAEDTAFARNFHAQLGERVLAFHPGSGSPTKNWPLRNWQELIAGARALGFEPLLVAGETEREMLSELTPLSSTQALNLPLTHLAAVLQQSRVFIGHDSGVTHLAAATGVPTIALFGPTDPARWAPPRDNVTVFRGGADWSGFNVRAVLNHLSES